MSIVEIAKQAGNGPEFCLRTYAHLWDELNGTGSAEDLIRRARSDIRGEKRVSRV